ncbi:MAG: hypothetical protein EBV32_00715 [Proteobacteria bacterium]|uniref:Terminase large subunit GpA endonuclease domain-containing protein n=1 Tax=Candidatus Fonsibacter lacus TaxID=2576439 RepID=A0A964UZP0_9PROT|nr:hypothetical protein [Candidatus Fonsibacter lacus]
MARRRNTSTDRGGAQEAPGSVSTATAPRKRRAAAPRSADEVRDRATAAYERLKAKAAARSKEVSNSARDIGDIPPVGDPVLREACEADLRTFLERCFPQAFRLGWCDDHLVLIEELQRVIERGGFRAVGMPRGTGKSTIIMRAMIWAIVKRLHPFSMIAAANAGKAEKLLRDIVTEWSHNPMLYDLWPEVAYPIRHTLPDGRVIRPSMLLCDDFQTRESALSAIQCHGRTEVIQNDLVGMRGPDTPFCALVTCTVIRSDDAADRLLNREINPDWCGIRRAFIRKMPDDAAMQLWSQYGDIRAASLREHGDIRDATRFYKEHKAAMDSGSEVAWPARYSASSGEISALQHGMEWYYRSRSGFFSELQNEPQKDENESRTWLTAQDIADSRRVKLPRGVAPKGFHKLVAMVDVQQTLLYYTVAAAREDGSLHVMRYGTFPEQDDPYFTLKEARRKLSHKYPQAGDMAALSQGITEFCEWLFSQDWRSEDGGHMTPELVAFDARWKTDLVKSALSRSNHRQQLLAYMGQSYRAADKPISERKYDPGSRVGLGWVIIKRKAAGDIRNCLSDVNYWKTAFHDQMAVRIGHAGAITLYDGMHRLYSEHLTSEYATQTEGRGRTVMEWRLRVGAENHWLDSSVGCLVLASVLGCNVPEVSEATEQKRRRRIKRRTEVRT